MKNRMFMGFLVLVLAIGGYLAFDFLVESEEEKVEAFIRLLVDELPNRNGSDYLEFVNLEKYGFSLSFRSVKQKFVKGDEDLFVKAADLYVKFIKGSGINLINVDVKMEGELALVKTTMAWQKKDSKAPVKQALIGCDGTIVKDGENYKIAKLKVYFSRDVISGLRSGLKR